MMTYLIQLNVALVLFACIYKAFLSTETNFKFSRFYLLIVLLTSLIIPIVNVDRLASLFIEDAGVVYEYWLPDLNVNSTPNLVVATPSLIWFFVVGFYFLGVAIGILRMTSSFFYLRWTFQNSKMTQDKEGVYYLLEGDKGSFSFFNYIFIGNKAWHTVEDRQTILEHERAHANHWHSFDVMLVQIIGIIAWFNPVIYWYRKTLEQLHEFEADSIASVNKMETYCGLLARDTLDSAQFSIANHFNKSLTLKRIAMINAVKNKVSLSKKISLAISVILIVVLVACEEKVLNDMKRAAGQSVLLDEYPEDVRKAVAEIKAKNPDVNPQVYGVVKTQDLENIDLKGKTATMFYRDNDPDYKVYVILGADDLRLASENTFTIQNGEKIYSIVEEPAGPVDGMANFYKFVAENLLYPAQARRMGVEGRVFIKFLVDEAGKISNVQIIRGIGAGCDEEAKRVMSVAPNWKPGKMGGMPVKSTFNLAIIFKLNDVSDGE